jgi:hypothetical protein
LLKCGLEHFAPPKHYLQSSLTKKLDKHITSISRSSTKVRFEANDFVKKKKEINSIGKWINFEKDQSSQSVK